MYLLKAQQRVAKENFDTTIFLEGIAGTGKSTAAIERIKQLIREGVAADSILVIVPQAALAVPYREALRRSRVPAGSDIHTATFGKLAFEMVDLFFPLIAEAAGFADPLARPHFLSLELVQYYMTRFLEPAIEQHDFFNSVHISRNRLYTQIVDNLNKAAVVRFDPATIADRLKGAWRGDVEQATIYDDAGTAAMLFREQCLAYNLLDFSLQMSLFVDHLWQMQPVRRYLFRQYRHLIVDNIEEDTPAAHDILMDWLPNCDSAVLIYDHEGGYRRFLGADPIHAYHLKQQCDVHVTLDNHRVMSDDMMALQAAMAVSLHRPVPEPPPDDADLRRAVAYDDHRYQPEMMDRVADRVAGLIREEGVKPSEIVILAPFLPDALRFSLRSRLDERKVPNRSHRPSRALREEPAARTLLTLAKVAHPDWEMPAGRFDLAHALMESIADLDLIRARLLADVLYHGNTLHPFHGITNTKIQERITYEIGARYDLLRQWLMDYQEFEPLPLDIFFSKLFGEVLSQRGFGFHERFDAAGTAANLIDSAASFRQTVSRIEPDLDTSAEYVQMVDNGVIGGLYIRDWQAQQTTEAVLVAPAYTFLLNNVSVDYQFWLNVGSIGWAQRLFQPLTQPYVMSRQWQDGDIWTDADEVDSNREMLSHLVLGLIRRCRKQIYLGYSQFGEQGYEQRGPLLIAVQTMLRRLQKEGDDV